MPSNVLTTDTLFPTLDAGEDAQTTYNKLTDYLFLLREQLTYTLSNLGIANLNAAQADILSETIREPLNVAISDTDAKLATLTITTDGLTTTVSTMGTTVSGLSTSLTTLSTTVSGISTSVSVISGAYVSKTSSTQTSTSFSLSVMDSTGSSAALKFDTSGLTVYKGKIQIKNNADVTVMSADTNGNLLLTGTISGSSIYGSTIYTSTKAAPTTGDYMVISGNAIYSYHNTSYSGVCIENSGALSWLRFYIDGNNCGGFLVTEATGTENGVLAIVSDYILGFSSGIQVTIRATNGGGIYLYGSHLYWNDTQIQ